MKVPEKPFQVPWEEQVKLLEKKPNFFFVRVLKCRKCGKEYFSAFGYYGRGTCICGGKLAEHWKKIGGGEKMGCCFICPRCGYQECGVNPEDIEECPNCGLKIHEILTKSGGEERERG
ncbi:MAG: hypothetical protein DRP47_09330 [Candidatus Zixiibacteriota bacterium]|nr:MAG: hypothetical protein DRP47_09330 [candidate division Zixibacteria bacterium]